MKCVYCGTELKDGSLYCSNCGKEVQIVPDYNVYDEDYLKQVLTEENRPTGSTASGTTEDRAVSNDKKKKQMYLIAGIVAVLVIAVAVAVVVALGVKKQHANSFEYQVQMAEDAYDRGNVDEAIEYYENALSLDRDNIDVRLVLAGIYMDRKDYDSALILCQEIIYTDNTNAQACEILISIYESQKNYDAVLALYEAVDDSLCDMFSAYVVTAPKFSITSGEYDKYVTLELSTSGDYAIYYSLDGSDPTLRGERYTMPIELKENQKTYKVSAVCMNDKGIYSDVLSEEYVINIPAPDMPIVTPDGGDFGVETTITVTIPNGCSAYYTWDGTDPTVYSTKYTGPITVPEGNNVLSVILADSATGLTSDVYRGNFVYYVEDSQGEQITGDDADDADDAQDADDGA